MEESSKRQKFAQVVAWKECGSLVEDVERE